MLQLNPPIPVKTPLGSGWAIIVIDYGPNFNTVWTVALSNDGQVKHFDSNDIKIETNYTFNFNLPKPN